VTQKGQTRDPNALSTRYLETAGDRDTIGHLLLKSL